MLREFGVCTTSRIEGLHAVIKKYLTSSCSLQKVFLCFRTLEQIEIDKFAEEYQRHQNKPSSNYEIQFLKEFEKVCSDYALRRIKPKFFKSLNYERKEIINKKLTSWYSKEIMFSFFREVFNLNSKFQHVVKLEKKTLRCSCQESLYEGLPCRHEICICVKEDMPISYLNIHDRWQQHYFTPTAFETISDSEEEDDYDEEIIDLENNQDSEEANEDHEEKSNLDEERKDGIQECKIQRRKTQSEEKGKEERKGQIKEDDIPKKKVFFFFH